LEECDLTKLSSFGPKFTWSNYREGIDFIKEKLDHGVAKQEWRDLFPNVEIKVEFSLGSDHLPIFLILNGKLGKRTRYKIFWNENSWALEEGCVDLIQQT
jgi:hypothetical protein